MQIIMILTYLNEIWCSNYWQRIGRTFMRQYFKQGRIQPFASVWKNNKLGGSLQTFGRKGCIFNTGLNLYRKSRWRTSPESIFSLLLDYIINSRWNDLIQMVLMYRLLQWPGINWPTVHDHYRGYHAAVFPGEKNGLTQYLKKNTGYLFGATFLFILSLTGLSISLRTVRWVWGLWISIQSVIFGLQVTRMS